MARMPLVRRYVSLRKYAGRSALRGKAWRSNLTHIRLEQSNWTFARGGPGPGSTTTRFITSRRVNASRERELEIAANAKAEQLATELTRKKDVQLEGLQQQLTEEQDKLAEERARHAEALRDQKAKLRDDAEREAARKVRADLLKKERLITGLKEEIDEQSRRIEHLTADERGEMNEELLLAQLQAAFPDDRIERVGRGRTGGDILHEIRVVRGRPRCSGLVVLSARTHSVGRTASWSRRGRRGERTRRPISSS